jgi:hypothetical protein
MFEQNLLKELAKEYGLYCEPLGMEYHDTNPCEEIPLHPLETLYRWSYYPNFSIIVRISGEELLIVYKFPLFGPALLHNRFLLVDPDSLDKLRSTIENLKERTCTQTDNRSSYTSD